MIVRDRTTSAGRGRRSSALVAVAAVVYALAFPVEPVVLAVVVLTAALGLTVALAYWSKRSNSAACGVIMAVLWTCQQAAHVVISELREPLRRVLWLWRAVARGLEGVLGLVVGKLGRPESPGRFRNHG